MNEMTAETFHISIGGFDAFQMSVVLKDGALVYEYRESMYGELLASKTIKPTEQQWRAFWGQVRTIGAQYWREEYSSAVLDGLQWEIELSGNELEVKSWGSNAYPPANKAYPSEAFKQLLKAVGELLDDNDFIKRWYYDYAVGAE